MKKPSYLGRFVRVFLSSDSTLPPFYYLILFFAALFICMYLFYPFQSFIISYQVLTGLIAGMLIATLVYLTAVLLDFRVARKVSRQRQNVSAELTRRLNAERESKKELHSKYLALEQELHTLKEEYKQCRLSKAMTDHGSSPKD